MAVEDGYTRIPIVPGAKTYSFNGVEARRNYLESLRELHGQLLEEQCRFLLDIIAGRIIIKPRPEDERDITPVVSEIADCVRFGRRLWFERYGFEWSKGAT